jgi:hypothetical protein
MKRTKKSWLFFILQIVFSLVVPCVLVWVQYGDLSKRFKIGVTVILLLCVVFLIFKKAVLNKWLKTIDTKITNIEANALSITDESAIATNKNTWRFYSIIQSLINYVIPILIFVLAVMTIKKVEQGVIKLYGVMILSSASFIIGMLFRWAEIYSMRLPHEKEK